jgi:hypothetical protein
MTVDPTSVSNVSRTRALVRKLTPRHSFNAILHSVLKTITLEFSRVQLENL